MKTTRPPVTEEDIMQRIDDARGTWAALSQAQRRVLSYMGEGYRSDFSALGVICGLRTARSLCARELIAVDGGAFDPESRFVTTERGRFVLAHGQSINAQNPQPPALG